MKVTSGIVKGLNKQHPFPQLSAEPSKRHTSQTHPEEKIRSFRLLP